MLSTNANFDAKHKDTNASFVPMYLVQFSGETDLCNHKPSGSAALKYLSKITGAGHTIEPEEGRSTIGGVTIEVVDVDDTITDAIAADTDSRWHRKAVTIKAGYAGMAEADMLTVFANGRVTGHRLAAKLLAHSFAITDPQKWMQREIFRTARTAAVTLSGNPINILLALLTSTGAGTNGSYDWYAETDGLALTTDDIDVADIESVRDDWFPGDSHYMVFSIDEPQKAKKFIEEELLKVLNCYPKITAEGKYSIRPFKPPLAAFAKVQSIGEEDLIGLPSVDYNFESLINEVEFSYDHDGSDFQTIVYYADGTSIANRGPGKKTQKIESKGLYSTHATRSISGRGPVVAERRAKTVFSRYSTPPLKLGFTTRFSKFLSEAGDVIPFSHSSIPNIIDGGRGISAQRMEIINRTVNWHNGTIKIDLLNTGFDKSIYGACSPAMTVTAAASGTEFTVSAADAARYVNLTTPEVRVVDAKGRSKGVVTLLTVNASTGVCTCDDIGSTPTAGWYIIFADYDSCTAEQKLYGFAADGTNTLGAAGDAAHICTP